MFTKLLTPIGVLTVLFLVPMSTQAQAFSGSSTGRTYYDFICLSHNAKGECTNYSYITPRDSFRGRYHDSDYYRGRYDTRNDWYNWDHNRRYDYYPRNRSRRVSTRRFRDDRFYDDDRYDRRYSNRRYDRGNRRYDTYRWNDEYYYRGYEWDDDYYYQRRGRNCETRCYR